MNSLLSRSPIFHPVMLMILESELKSSIHSSVLSVSGFTRNSFNTIKGMVGFVAPGVFSRGIVQVSFPSPLLAHERFFLLS